VAGVGGDVMRDPRLDFEFRKEPQVSAGGSEYALFPLLVLVVLAFLTKAIELVNLLSN
jgi:hypothetical protein